MKSFGLRGYSFNISNCYFCVYNHFVYGAFHTIITPVTKAHSARRGFTLIELLVVVAIIAILTAITMAVLSDARAKSRDARRFEDIKQIQNALELYSADRSGLYPSGTSLAPLVTGNYIQVLPTDPRGTGSYAYSYQALTSSLVACGSGNCPHYVLKSVLEQDSQLALDSDIDGLLGGVNCEDPAFCLIP